MPAGRLLLPLLLAAFALSTPAQQPLAVLPLWPHALPEPPQTTAPEQDTTKPTDGQLNGHRTSRLTNITRPTISVYPPPVGVPNTGAAAVVFPGGGYSVVVFEGEGLDTCKWLNSAGLTCLVVKYRVPEEGRYPANPADLEDAQQAMRLARTHAAAWHFDPHRLGVVGFSAGGHLVVALSNHFDDPHVLSTPAAPDVQASVSARPDFTVAIYPAYLTALPSLDRLAPALDPNAQTPPTFLLMAENDQYHAEDVVLYYAALMKAKVPAELHVYPTGGHGFGIFPTGIPEAHWTAMATEWLHTAGVLQ